MSGCGGMEAFSTIGKMGKKCFEKSKRKHVWLELGDALYWDRWAFIVVAVAWVMSHREKERERGLECYTSGSRGDDTCVHHSDLSVTGETHYNNS